MSDQEEEFKRMLSVSGRTHEFVIVRPMTAIDRDGLDVTISAEATVAANEFMLNWFGSRIMRSWQRTGVGPQRVVITLTVDVEELLPTEAQ